MSRSLFRSLHPPMGISGTDYRYENNSNKKIPIGSKSVALRSRMSQILVMEEGRLRGRLSGVEAGDAVVWKRRKRLGMGGW